VQAVAGTGWQKHVPVGQADIARRAHVPGLGIEEEAGAAGEQRSERDDCAEASFQK
jgi:hypothetical protein